MQVRVAARSARLPKERGDEELVTARPALPASEALARGFQDRREPGSVGDALPLSLGGASRASVAGFDGGGLWFSFSA